jgi:AcrR family transcriptional regulator
MDEFMPRAQSSRGDASRERILATAIELFAERGYAGTSVSEICRRAGAVATSLYHHFGSKEGLLGCAIERVGLSWIEEIQKQAYREEDLGRRLDRVVDMWRQLVTEQPALLRMLISVQLERSQDSSEVGESLRILMRRTRASLVEGIEASVGALPGADYLAHTMLALLQGALLRLQLEPKTTDADALFRDMRRTIELALADRVDRRPAAEQA